MASFVLPTVSRTVQTNSSTEQWIPMTGWIPAISAEEARVLWELKDEVGSIQARPGYQSATTSQKDPGTPNTMGLSSSTEGKKVVSVTVGTGLADHMWVRFGVWVKSVTNDAYSQCEIVLTVAGTDQ